MIEPSSSSVRAATTTVLGAWLASRVISLVLLTVVGSRTAPDVDTTRLLTWDGNWYRHIMLHGYGDRPAVWPPGPDQWTPLPFFPLYPGLARVLNDIGLPVTVALVSIPNVAFLAALFGIFRLARRRGGDEVAVASVWIAALLPGALTFTMAYPDAIFLAGSVWAVVWASEERYALAAGAAVLCTATRPNGLLVVMTVALVVLSSPGLSTPRRLRAIAICAVPSAVFLAGWMWFMQRRIGDPLAFLTAKRAWEEDSLFDALTDPNRQVLWQLSIGTVMLVVVIAARRRLPAAWTAHSLMCLLPALALGVVGLIRYSAQAFPVPIAIASLSRARGRTMVVAIAVGCAVLLVVYGILITRESYVP